MKSKSKLKSKPKSIPFNVLELEFKSEVHNYASEVDPSNEQDWYSLALGWALGKGYSAEEAHDVARYLRYTALLA